MDVPVVPFLRVVANGVATLKDGGPQRLRATLIATPEPVAGDAIELSDWPSAFAKRVREGHAPAAGRGRFTVRLREVRWRDGRVEFVDHYREAEVVGHAGTTPDDWDGATRAWQAAMQQGPSKDPWTELGEEIRRSLTGKKRTATPQPRYALPDTLPADFDADGAILAKGPEPGQLSAIEGIVPVRQGLFAIDEERVRAARVLAKLAAGPHTIEDEPCLLPEGGGRKTPQDFSERRKQKHYLDFRDAVRATDAERTESAATFAAVKGLVGGQAATTPKPCGMRGDRAVLPSAERVRDGKADGAERSTHDYGTWLQRRPELATTWDGCKNRIVPAPPRAASSTPDAELAAARVHGVFYAVQGDPILSRLFCLAVDLEFALPDDLKGREGPVYLQLSIERADEASRCTPVVATAAKLSGTAFWPVSVFEAGLSGCEGSEKWISDPCSVEQSDGFWRLDAGYAPDDPGQHTPRYDLSSLDIRRSVDAKPDGTDRGQRHLTAGFTVLDHGRGAQVARDLALAAVNAPCVEAAAEGCTKRPTAVLYAEELTIGRRVDVAGAGAGAGIDKLRWRSLMQRLVRFDGFEPRVQRLLRHLLKGSERGTFFLDEASFQVAARLIPVLGADAAGGRRPLEAVAEEAIFLWDGTPASVLTEPGTDAKPVEDLPFSRRLEAPDLGNVASALRPVPLRFGASYVFRLRSMFLGGGSPAADTPLTESQGGALLPPAIGNRSIPRRFLRHESVLPPMLLLPVHLATKPVGYDDVMGYELADQAIVRSGVKADDRPGDERPEPGAPYVPVAKRCFPEETARVFVVPQAAPDTVRRHGKLPDDRAAREVVLRGGLLDVAFDPVETSEKPVRRATNFPTVITRSVPGFGNEGVVQARTLSRGKDDEIGIPVFEPGGRNTTKLGQIGYLPDPAVDMMVVRLRVRRSGRYLDGHVAVDVYDPKAGIAYPNALPLVVSVRRSTEDRPKAAVALKSVLAHEIAELRWMDSAGSLAAGRPKHGRATRVRHLLLNLCRGEDFDLEVACLPNEKTFGLTFSLPETIAMQLAEAAADEDDGARLAKLAGPLEAAPFTVRSPTYAQAGFTGLAGRRVPSGGAVERAAEEILAAIKDKWPVEEIAAVTTVRVCHAVNAPAAFVGQTLTDLKARRPDLPDTEKQPPWEECPDLPDSAGAKTLLLSGTLKLDLERVDAFELVATSAAATVRALDDKNRSRSLIARRSGRWPKLTTADGDRRYIAPRYVVGFDIDAQACATFVPETVTLLRVHNLPARAEEGIGSSLFGKREGRLTCVSLGRLFASAIAGRPIAIPVDGDAPAPSGTCGKERRHVVTASRPHIIEDTRARKLILRVTAMSRSAEAFETAPRYGGNGPPTLHRRQPLEPYDQSRTSARFEVWVPSTLRPPVCEVRRPEVAPIVIRKADARQNGVVQVLRRDLMTRFWLKRGWGASGEGERLGIVLWPPSYFTQAEGDIDGDVVKLGDRRPSIASFEDADLGPGGAFVTRWGGDPIRRDAQPQSGFLIPPKAFTDALEGCASPHKPKIVDQAMMPVRRMASEKEQGEDGSGAGPAPAEGATGTKEVPDGFMKVTLLTFEPCFDLDREEWFVDVDLKPIRAAEPFVRFGLVRYQENAISDALKVSFPVSVQAQLMPSRELHVEPCTCPKGKPAISVTLRGNGSLGIKPLKIEQAFRGDPNLPNYLASFGKLEKPDVRVTVFHEAGAPTELLLRTRLSQTETWISAENSLDVASLVWTARVPLPDDRLKELGKGMLVAYVEEIDRRMPSSYAIEPIAPETLFDEKTFRESGPRFNARIPFLDVT